MNQQTVQTARIAPADEAETRPALVVSAGVDLSAAAAALPGFDLHPLKEIVPGSAGSALLCLAAPADAKTLPKALAAAGLAHLTVVPWQGSASELVAAMAERLTDALADAGAARRTAALLRREDEALNRRFKALEGFAWALGGPHASLALFWTLRAGVACPANESEEIRQRLPLDISALAAIELQISGASAAAAAMIRVAIEDSEGQRHPLQLVTGSAQSTDGWLRFAAETPLAIDPQDGTLVISTPTRDTVFGLGITVSDPDFAASGLEGVNDTTLALRVWKGIAGVAGQMAPIVPASERLRHERLMPSDLPEPRILARPNDAQDFIKAEFWPQENAFLVHPSANGPVCALVAHVPAMALMRLSAVVNVARRDSAVLGFAIGYAPSGQATVDNWQDFIGEWTFLPPNAWGEVHAPIGAMAGMPARHWDILLASCIVGNTTNDHAWALYRSFRLSLGIEE